MTRARYRLESLGFDLPRLTFALRTALAASLALILAWALGLEHPQWAAMTVWCAAQPVRGMLIEKSIYRAVGTVVGSLFGVLLVLLADGSIPLLVSGLTLWISLCVAAGNLIHGLPSYAVLLSGYSAAMVSLLHAGPPGDIFGLGVDRLLTVLTGVVTALLVGLLLTRRSSEPELQTELLQHSGQLLQWWLEGNDARTDAATGHRLNRLAQLEQRLTGSAYGSLRARRYARRARHLLHAQVALLLRPGPELAALSPVKRQQLNALAQALQRNESQTRILQQLRTTMRGAELPAAELQQLLWQLRLLLQTSQQRQAPETGPVSTIILHRDWIGARQAMLRAAALLLALGCFWWLTGWHAGHFLLLGASVMITLFSTFENPSAVMRNVFFGQVLGALTALACEWLIWPLMDSSLERLLVMIPFIFCGALPVAHRRTQSGAMDFNLIMLLLLQPLALSTHGFEHSLTLALAVVSAPLLALVCFRYLYPTNKRQRRQNLIRMIVHDLERQAKGTTAVERRAARQARLHHRALRLLQLTAPDDHAIRQSSRFILAAHEVGRHIEQLQLLLQKQPDLKPRTRRRIQLALRHLARLETRPERACRALAICIERCYPTQSKPHYPHIFPAALSTNANAAQQD